MNSRVLNALLLTVALSPAQAQEPTTFIFADVVRSNGSGSIDLFRPQNKDRVVTGAVLELFRLDNGGELVFAVDVNEAASGTESADSQGVAIATATLIVEFGDGPQQFGEFRTPTRSLLAAAGGVSRTEYYTLVGTAGSNRVSPNAGSELTGSSLDETLHFPVSRDLTGVTAARLDITFLDVNTDLGDPEAFYDYSNGFEEVALLSRADAEYLAALSPGRDLAPLVISDVADAGPSYNWIYHPSSQGHYVASYEDLYPDRGDYDFNDLVVAYQVSVGTDGTGAIGAIRGNGYLIARGASYDHDWHLRIPLPEWARGSQQITVYAAGAQTPLAGYPRADSVVGTADLVLAERVAAIFADGSSTFVNTFPEQGLVQGPKFDFEIQLSTPVPADQIGAPPYDPYLYVHDTNVEVHLIGMSPVLGFSRNTQEGLNSFRDSNGYPFAMVIPEFWNPPLAGVDMGLAYPGFIDHVRSNGANNPQWYLAPENARIKAIPQSHWKW